MPTLNDVSNEVQFAMLKGEPGTRKSTQALSYPTPQYWFSTDQKMGALTLPMKRWGVNAKEVHYDDYKDWNSIRKKLEFFQVSCPYKTIIADSITSIADATNRQTLKMKTGTSTKSGDDAGRSVGGIQINTMEDYKAEAAAFQEFIALLKDISQYHKCNIIMIAHVIGARQSLNQETTNTHFARIIVTGGQIISAKIPAYCDEVYHFNVKGNIDLAKEPEYALLTRHTGADFARTSLPLPAEIVFNNEPMYERFILPAIKKLKDEVPVTKL